jgi:hypothetical protein
MSEKTNMFGRTLVKINNARAGTRMEAEKLIWERNGLANPTIRKGYELREKKKVLSNGTEVVEYELYKLIDAVTTTISTQVTSQIVDSAQEKSHA